MIEENQSSNGSTSIQKSRSPNISQFSMDYGRNLIKSMESILSTDTIKEKSHKKQLYMRRSVTLKDVSDFKLTRKSGTNISFDRIKLAKEKVEEAIKNGKIFAILGPYSRVRQVLRNRGWVEKFYLNNDLSNNTISHKNRSTTNKVMGDKNPINDGDDIDDDGDDDDDIDDYDEIITEGEIPPWEEDDGIYGIMSRMLKSVVPNLFWTLRKNQVDFKTLRKDQIINHHAKAGCFTTKTGLAKSLNQLRWFDDKEPDEFFPRCYTISTMEEKHAFIDDYHFTACTGLIKEVIENSLNQQTVEVQIATDQKLIDQSTESSNDKSVFDNQNGKTSKKILPKIRYFERKSENHNSISHKFLDMAIAYCEFILKIKKHEDIDRNDFIFCWSCDWDEFLVNYYKVVHEGFKIEGSQHTTTLKKCEEIASELRKIFFQFDMEGSRNVWILKPGAKSRGRGIACYTKLHDVLKLVSNSLVTNETRFIIQKYIERPLLVCNTKFDIRQWFLVTDWNPLTIWWYKDCYLRFCSQQFTLDDLNEAVHLSNNSIQHKYHNGPRSTILPCENMWDWKQFEEWLNNEGHLDAWSKIILPGMKEAVVDALLCVQDSIDWRKNTFELYGADFMVSEMDLKPWLIEINSSPCMAPSTSITARLTSNVLEDIFKVVIDRRENKQCDTGQFELLYKQVQIHVPPYIGIDLKLAGISIKNPLIASTILTERRVSTRSITDSVVIRNTKRKDDRTSLRRKIQETSLATSTVITQKEKINKSGEIKPSFMHKRSNTTIVVQNDKSKLKLARKAVLPHQKGPTSPFLSKSAKLIIGNTKENTDITKISNSLLPEIEHEEISEDNNVVTESCISSNEASNFDSNLQINESISNINQNNDKRRNQYLPTLTKYNIFPKPNLTRQYKLPTKVEVVNFSMAKKMMSSSFKEPLIRKKIKQSSHTTKSLNSQLLIQKYSLTKSITNFHNLCKSFNKNCKFERSYILVNDDLRLPNKSKSSISSHGGQKTMKILSKREDNNSILLINLSTSVT